MNRKEKYSEENIKKAVKYSTCIKEALGFMGLRAAGGNYKVFHKYVDKYKIDTSHFDSNKHNDIGKWRSKNKIPLSDVLVKNSTYSRGCLKIRLYKEGLKERKCEMKGCGQGEMWMGKKMSLILDHINGIHDDNRINNLRIVCANCNATLPTHAGKNKRNKKEYKCSDCGCDVSKKAKKCQKCANSNNPRLSRRIVQRPPYIQLQQEIEELGYSGTGRKYGVSDNAIRKWIKSFEKYEN